jgi:hypothetical protein
VSSSSAEADAPRRPRVVVPGELFTHEVRKDGRPLVLLRGIESDDGGVTVETDVYPAGVKPGTAPRRRPFSFATRDQALRFVDDTLDSLEYLNCNVVD